MTTKQLNQRSFIKIHYKIVKYMLVLHTHYNQT